MMGGKPFWFLVLLLISGLASACSNDLDMTVHYGHAGGLRPGDRVLFQGKPIGSVEAVEVDSKSMYAVHLDIKEDFREMITDRCRFLVLADPHNRGRTAVAVLRLAGDGRPLSDGAEVEGSTALSVLLERGSQELEAWQKRFADEIDRWQRELQALSEDEWYQELERSMERWAEEIERGGEEVRQYFEREVLPALEAALRELKKRLKERGEEQQVQPLEIKLERMKRI